MVLTWDTIAGVCWRIYKASLWGTLVAVLPDAAVAVQVVGLWAFTLDAGTVHGTDAAQLVVRVAPATQTGLEEEGRKKHKMLKYRYSFFYNVHRALTLG